MSSKPSVYKIISQKKKKERIKRALRKGEFKIFDSVRRRADRRMKRGLENEERIESILSKAVASGRYSGFKRTIRHGREDGEGKDFIVMNIVRGKVIVVSFGVTISHQKRHEAALKHPGISCFVITPEMKDETLFKKIDRLFEEEK